MKKIFIIIILIGLTFYSCKDEDIINNPDLISTQASQDNLFAENIFNDEIYIIKESMQNSSKSKSCPDYNLINSNSSDIDTLIIDFGNSNCLNNGKLRRGVINMIFSGRYTDSSSVISSTFNNYYINNNLVQGEVVIINQGIINTGNTIFDIEVKNASINTSNGTINWNSTTNWEWISGKSTVEISDDSYTISGKSSGNGVNGNAFITTITNTLKLDFSCLPYCVIKSGLVKVSPDEYNDRNINYGDSLCDCVVEVIVNEESHPLTIIN